MSKTDRQTDKSSAWSVTAFNEEILLLEDASTYPEFVKEVLGGREMCPKTSKLHFQGAVILHSQQRLSALKKWLPTAHWEPAKQRDALKRYAMKADTAVGEKTIRENAIPYLDIEAKMRIMAEAYITFSAEDVDKEMEYRERDPKDGEFWYLLTCKVLPKYGGKIINSFAYPEVRVLWRNTKEFWIRKDQELRQPPLSITEAADTLEIKSPAGIYTNGEAIHEAEGQESTSEA